MKRISLQWQLTIMNALVVVAACMILCYFMGYVAILKIDQIGDSAVWIMAGDNETTEDEFGITVTEEFVRDVAESKYTFLRNSIIVTLLITLISSVMVYLAVGYTIRPLEKLNKQVMEIQAKNLSETEIEAGGSIEMVNLSSAFNGMLKRLGEAFSVQRQFAGNAAHELRTPLAVIRSKLDVFHKKDDHSQAEYEELMNMIQNQTGRLSHVVDILLEMTQLKSAERSDRIGLSEISEEVICDLTDLARKKSICLLQDDKEVSICGSSILIYRAIYNLIENAIKYNREGGSVHVSAGEDAEYAFVTVEDTGFGIGRENFEKIFDPFFRVDKSRSRAMGGAGLGLALVKEIAMFHGGDVRVLESSAKGTRIQIRFGN